MAIQYKAYEFQVYDVISRFSQLLPKGDGGADQWRQKAERLKKNLEQKKFRIAVVGEFNRGKTSFVNALLGKVILPADYVPTTATINRITYSDAPAAYILFKDGRKEAVEISRLSGYVTKLTKESEMTAADIQEAVVEYPSLLCRNDVDLIDTPGMNDEEAMNAVTISRLQDIDLAIVAVDPTMPFSMTECVFTAKLLESPQICQIIFVVTKMDTVRERDREKTVQYLEKRIKESVEEYLLKYYEKDNEILQKYHDIFDSLNIFPVSSLDALDALSCNDMDGFEKSGFLELNDRLPQIIMSSQNKSIILNSVREAERSIEEYRKWLKKRQEQWIALLPQLEALKTSFGQTGRSLTKNMFLSAEKGLFSALPNPERETEAIKGKFVQALSCMRTLDYEELKRVFHPVINEINEFYINDFAKREGGFWDGYVKGTLELKMKGVCSRLNQILLPYQELHKAVQPKIMEFYNDFPVIVSVFDKYIKEKNIFKGTFWIASPLPQKSEIGPDWNIMPYVVKAIYISVEKYGGYYRQVNPLKLEEAQKSLDGSMERLILHMRRETEEFSRRLQNGGMEGKLIARLSELEEKCRSLRMEFLDELRKA